MRALYLSEGQIRVYALFPLKDSLPLCGGPMMVNQQRGGGTEPQGALAPESPPHSGHGSCRPPQWSF